MTTNYMTAGGAVIGSGLGRRQLPNCWQSDHSQRWFSVQDPDGQQCLTVAPRASITAGSLLDGILPTRARGPPKVCTRRAAQTP